MYLTIWKDGTWTVWQEGDAYYAMTGDPDWLVNIKISEIR